MVESGVGLASMAYEQGYGLDVKVSDRKDIPLGLGSNQGHSVIRTDALPTAPPER